MLGDLSTNIVQSHNPCSQNVAGILIEFGLVDLLHYFRQRWRFCHLKTWSQMRQCRLLQARCDYILGTDRSPFKMAGIRYVRNNSSDQFTLRARLLHHPLRCHISYLRGRRAFPLYLPTPEEFGLQTGNSKS